LGESVLIRGHRVIILGPMTIQTIPCSMSAFTVTDPMKRRTSRSRLLARHDFRFARQPDRTKCARFVADPQFWISREDLRLQGVADRGEAIGGSLQRLVLLRCFRRFGALLNNVLHNRQSRKGIRPTCVERQMRHELARLLLSQPIIHSFIQMKRYLCHLAHRN
jgi:hypothetical protein